MGKTNSTVTPDETLAKVLDEFHSGAIFPDREDARELGMEAWEARDADEAYHNTISSEDAAADANTQSLSDNVAVNLPTHTGAAGMA